MVISGFLNILLLLLLIAVLIEYKAYGDKCYSEGKAFASFSALVPEEQVLVVWCKGGSLYIYDDRYKSLIKSMKGEKCILVE